MIDLVITDSGVGGLSVCAYAERFVRTHGFAGPVRLVFVNAAPENDYGYNAMPSREVKLATFDRFLAIVAQRYAPQAIYVACNTLSVLLPDTPFARNGAVPVHGIVDTAIDLVMRELAAQPDASVLVFATQTTIDAGAYPRRLAQRGVQPERIIGQACPGLADTISEDRDGARTRAQIESWVHAALARLPRLDQPVVACLACTHYGYRKQLFAEVLAEAGLRATIVNPNECAIDGLLGAGEGGSREVAVEVVSRYAIPPAALDTLARFLGEISPPTVAALRAFTHVPELF